jgi:hypothetical protein
MIKFAVGIVTTLRDKLFRFRISVCAKDFSLLQNVQIGPGAHPALCLMGTGDHSEVRRPGRQDDSSLSYSAKFKNE